MPTDSPMDYNYKHGCVEPHALILGQLSNHGRDSARSFADNLAAIGRNEAAVYKAACDVTGAVKDASRTGEQATRQVGCDLQGDIKDARHDVKDAVTSTRGDLRGDIKDARFDVVRSVETGFAAASRDVCGLGKEVGLGFAGVEKSICHSDQRTSDAFGVVRHDICDVNAGIAASREANLGLAKDASALAYQIEGRSALNAERIGNAASVQATMYANQLSVQADKLSYEGRLQAQTYASDAIVRAERIAAESARQTAALRCDVLEKISSDGQSTRALITDNRLHDLERKLADAQSAVRDAKLERLICCGCGNGSGGHGGGGNGNGNGPSSVR